MKWLFLYVLLFSEVLVIYVSSNVDFAKTEVKSTNLPPCQSCKQLVTSFEHGMEKTARGKFEGGDAAWEQEKMNTYSKSEVRLVEIQERLCNEIEKAQYQCHRLAEENEHLLEEWWKEQESDLYSWLCIDKLKVCCPEQHYGKNCTPCKGYPDKVCNNNGRCKGSGTRKGNGDCSCTPGYDGTNCDICAEGYFESYKDENKILCSKCHNACQKICTQAGPKGCVACNPGWFMDAEHGCIDVNECLVKPDACTQHQFCVNNDGSYSCIECDKACKTCNGDGPDMCDECAEGFYLQDNVCIDGSKDSVDMKMNLTRYITYLGLCIATCIIFQKNTYAASAIGVAVALYISVSEYILSSTKGGNNVNLDLQNLFNSKST